MNFSKRTLRSIVIGLLVAAMPVVALASDTFSDVDTTAFYHGAVNNIAGAGITAGCGTGTYCPGNSVSRGEMAVFLNRAGAKIGFDSAVDAPLTTTASTVASVTITGNGSGATAVNMVKVDASFTNTGAEAITVNLTDGTTPSRSVTVAAGASASLTWAYEAPAAAATTFSLQAAASATTSTVSGEITAIQGLFGPDGGNSLVTP